MEKEQIDVLKDTIKSKMKNKEAYSQRMVTSLSMEQFKKAYNNTFSLEALAYQRGLDNGMTLILSFLDEINEVS